MTLSELRARLRQDLRDPGGTDERFSDQDLDRAIDRALGELSRVVPWLRDATLSTSTGSRLVDLSTLGEVWTVEEVEWPLDEYPPRLCQFMVLPEASGAPGYVFLLVAEAPAAAEPVRVRWGTKHVASDTTWTLPAAHEELLAQGAYGYACLAYATPQSDNFRYQDGAQGAGVDTTMVAAAWWEKGMAALQHFRTSLERLRQARAAASAGRVAWQVSGDEEK